MFPFERLHISTQRRSQKPQTLTRCVLENIYFWCLFFFFLKKTTIVSIRTIIPRCCIDRESRYYPTVVRCEDEVRTLSLTSSTASVLPGERGFSGSTLGSRPLKRGSHVLPEVHVNQTVSKCIACWSTTAWLEVSTQVLWWFSTVVSLLPLDKRTFLSFLSGGEESAFGCSPHLFLFVWNIRMFCIFYLIWLPPLTFFLFFFSPLGLPTIGNGSHPINFQRRNGRHHLKGFFNLSVFMGLWWCCCMFVCSLWRKKINVPMTPGGEGDLFDL